MKKKMILIFWIIILLVFGLIMLKYKTYASQELPRVYITVEDEEAFRNLTKSEGEKTASLVYDNGSGETISSYIKIKVQGSSSAYYPKKNYTIKLYEDSEYSKKQKVDMGWGEFNKYCLKANWTDSKTHSRNIVTARLSAMVQEAYGLFTDSPNNGVIDGFPVQIYLNDEFLGLYTWNIPKDAWIWNLDEDNPDHIAMEAALESESTRFKEKIETVDRLGEDKNDPSSSGWIIESGSETQETVDKFDRLISFVKDSTDEEFIKNFDNYINRDAMLNYLVFVYMTEATDNVSKNMIWVTYDGQIWFPTLYDLDTTYGVGHWDTLHENYLWLPEDGYEMESAPLAANDSVLLKRVVKCFPDEFAERWFELRKNILSNENILKEFNDFVTVIPESIFELDKTTWEKITGKKMKGWDFNQIKEFLNERLPYIDEVMYNKYTDDMPATLSLQYSTTSPTRENVTVIASPNRSDITFGTNVTTYTFSSNGTYTFKAIDGAGNTVTETATVDWIDTISPTLFLDYSITEITKNDIKVTITANEEIQEVNGWTRSTDKKVLTKKYKQNSEETIIIKDIAGNETPVEVTITNIDKTVPEANVDYLKEANENVKVTITANEEIQEVDGWILDTNKKALTKEFTQNTTETIIIKDIAGNEKTVLIQVTGIIKIKAGPYEVDESYIMNIQPKTTYENFVKNIEINSEYKVTEDNEEITGSLLIKTGQKLTIDDKTFVLVVIGDVTGDGQVDIKDILAINKHRLNKSKLADEYLLAGDINEDEKVDLKDILQINKYRLGKITNL